MGAAKPKAEPDKHLRIASVEGRTEAQCLADVTIDPAANAAATVLMFSKGTFGNTGISETFEALRDSVQKVRKGDLAGPEAMLVLG